MRSALVRLTALTAIIFITLTLTLPLVSAETPWLEDYSYRKLITVAGSAGAGTDYVVFVKVYYASGTDGFEVLTGGHNGVNSTKVYLAGNVEADFDDVRFTETDGETELSYFRDTYTASTSALFAVEVSEDLETEQSFYIYFGDAGQATESSAVNTFKRVISSGIVLALPMNEGAGLTCEDYSGNNNDGTLTVGGGGWVTTGKWGNGIYFDGVASELQINDHVSLDTNMGENMSAMTWWTPSEQDLTSVYMLCKGSDIGYDLICHGAGVFFSCETDGAGYKSTGSNVIRSNTWTIGQHYCVIGTYEDPTLKMFLDGTQRSSKSESSGDVSDWNLKLKVARDPEYGPYSNGTSSGAYLFDYALSDPEIADLAAYYPQCSSGNLGSLYLRSFVNPEPQPSSIGSLEINNRYASTNYVWMAVLLVIGFVFMGFMLLRRGN